MKKKYDVIGMTCSACSAHVDKAVRGLDGVDDVNVNLLQNSMTVEFNENKINENQILKRLIKRVIKLKILVKNRFQMFKKMKMNIKRRI